MDGRRCHVARDAAPGQQIAVVTHGGVIDCLYRASFRIALEAKRTWKLGNASIDGCCTAAGLLTGRVERCASPRRRGARRGLIRASARARRRSGPCDRHARAGRRRGCARAQHRRAGRLCARARARAAPACQDPQERPHRAAADRGRRRGSLRAEGLRSAGPRRRGRVDSSTSATRWWIPRSSIGWRSSRAAPVWPSRWIRRWASSGSAGHSRAAARRWTSSSRSTWAMGAAASPPGSAAALARHVCGDPHMRFGGLQAYHGRAQHLRSADERGAAIRHAASIVRAAQAALSGAGIACPLVTGAGTGTFTAGGGQRHLGRAAMRLLRLHGPRLRRQRAAAAGAALRARPLREEPGHEPRHLARRGRRGPQVACTGQRPAERVGHLRRPRVRQWRRRARHPARRRRATALPALGDAVWLVPGHCDPTVNLHDMYVVVRGGLERGVVEALWPIDARGCVG